MENLKLLLTKSINQLIQNDKLLFSMPTTIECEESDLERKLHEVCINHRFAVYLEKNLVEFGKIGYDVDIEYNRNFEFIKRARRSEDEYAIIVRPDILIHKRLNPNIAIANYLVIEAKKGNPSYKDIDKIERLILDPAYKYKFGLTVSYLRNEEFVDCVIYYEEDNTVKSEIFSIRKI